MKNNVAFVTQKHLARRTFLRGASTALALPLLDAMVPALKADRLTAAAPVKRMGIVFSPNGVVLDKWWPSAEGKDFPITPTLEPVAAFRDKMIVIGGLDSGPGSRANGHDRALCTWLTGIEPSDNYSGYLKSLPPSAWPGISVDQIAGQHLGKETQISTLELGVDPSAYYSGGISFNGSTTALPLEFNPRGLFERLFGDGDSIDPVAMAARNQGDQSLLDFVSGELGSLKPRLSARDKVKLDQYLTSVRDVERRIQMAEKQMKSVQTPFTRPAGIPDAYPDYVKLMFDLQVLAVQADLTRVWTFLLGAEASVLTYPHLGIPDAHHELSHNDGRKEKIDALQRITLHHVEMFSYFVKAMEATKEGDGSLLDHSLLLYGSDMSNGGGHSTKDLPLVVVGGSAAGIKGGRYIRYKAATPLTNLHLTMLDKIGVPTEKLGNSTGELDRLWDL